MGAVEAVFSDLRREVAAAPTPEHRDLAVDRAMLRVQQLLLNEAARVRQEAYTDGLKAGRQSMSVDDGGLVKIKRSGSEN